MIIEREPRVRPTEGEPDPEVLRRQTDVSFPARVRAGKVYLLRVQVVPSLEVLPTGEVRLPRPHDHDVDLALAAPPEGQPLRVAVSVAAENFEVEGPARAEVLVPLTGKSSPALFYLRGLEPGPARIMVDFWQDGRPVGSVDLAPEVQAGEPAGRGERAPLSGEVCLAPAGEGGPPDVILKVFEHRHAPGPGRLHFVLFSSRTDLQDLPVLDGDLGTQDLRTDLTGWVEDALGALAALAAREDATPQEVERGLGDVGHKLFGELLPEKLRGLCWTLRKRGVRSLLVLSDEPHVPWELVKPYRADEDGALVEEDGFWGETFALTHWLRGRPPARRLGLGRVLAVAALGRALRDLAVTAQGGQDVRPGCIDNPAGPGVADEELGLLRSLPAGGAFVQLPAQARRLREAFEQGEFDLLHLACHGTFGGGDTADRSAVVLEDGPFRAADLSPRMAGPLRKSAPLIFFNACHSGRVGFALTGLGSWGARLVQMGCGGFVGALWPVTDRAAVAFARAFYEGLTRGLPIGEAVRAARAAVRERYPGDPTWLAYRCFADPLAQVKPASP
jgi:hypothetical protein